MGGVISDAGGSRTVNDDEAASACDLPADQLFAVRRIEAADEAGLPAVDGLGFEQPGLDDDPVELG